MPRSRLAVVAILLCLVGVTAATAWLVHRVQHDRAHEAAQRSVERAAAALESRLRADRSSIAGVQALLHASRSVSSGEFATFTRRLIGPEGFPAVSFVRHVPVAERARYERSTGLEVTERSATGMVRAGRRRDYFPVTYSEDRYPGPSPALGFDTGSVEVRRRALSSARDSGEARATPPLEVVGIGGGRGFILFEPIYRGGVTPASVAGRRARLVGFAAGVHLYAPLAAAVARQATAGTPFNIRVEHILVHGARLSGATASGTVDVAGQRWTITEARLGPGHLLPFVILAAGALLAMLAGALFATLMRRERYAMRLVAARMAERDAEEARFRALVESAPDAIVLADEDGVVVGWNRAAERMFGYAEDEMVGRPLTRIIPERLHADHERGLARVRRSGRNELSGRCLPLVGRRRDGSKLPIELTLSSWETPGGRFFNGIMRDVSVRVEAERRLEAGERRFRTLSTHAPVGIFETDGAGACLFVNAAWSDITGIDGARAAGAGWTAALHPEDAPEVVEAWAAATREGRDFAREFRFRRPDGEERWVAARGIALRDERGEVTGFIGTVVDLTARMGAERELEHSRRFLEAVLESVSEGVVACDGEGRLALFNRATRVLHGLPEEPLPPEAWADHYDLYRVDGTRLPIEDIPLARAYAGEEVLNAEMVIAPRGRARRLMRASGRPIRGDRGEVLGAVVSMHDITAQREAEDRLRDEHDRSAALIGSMQDGLAMLDGEGTIIEANARFLELVGLSAGAVVGRGAPYAWWPSDDGAPHELLGRIASGRAGELEAVLRRSDGEPIPALVATAPVRGAAGAEIVMSVKDITERREMERLKDEFVALASHELRTPLTAVLGYLQLVLDGAAGELDPKLREFLEVAERNSVALQHLVDDLLTVARADAERLPIDPERLDLRELAAECLQDAAPTAEERGIDLSLAPGPEVPLVGDRRRLREVVTNLVANATKFTPPGGRVVLRTAADATSAALEVEDTGIGIAPDELARLFERFYRSPRSVANEIPGTGLGLAISKLIAEAHGGRIAVTSEEGRGSVFRLELPVATREAARAAATAGAAP